MNISKLFPYRKYQVYVVNTPSELHLYLWENWKNLYPSIDAIINISSSKKAYIRSCQSLERGKGSLGFGRMVWNKQNNEKWTKKYREGDYVNENVKFFSTQIWAPDWNAFIKDSCPPDVFVMLYHYPNSKINREGLVLAIPKRNAKKKSKEIESLINDISTNIAGSTVKSITRSWWPGSGFPNQIQDLNPQELEKITNVDK